MRILHLPVVYGRQAWGLSRAERTLGHQSDFVAFENNFSRMPCDATLFADGDSLLVQELKRWRFFLKSIRSYDVFHFHFGQKFFVLNPRAFKKGDRPGAAILRLVYWVYSLFVGKLDLWVLRLLGKSMVMTYHGDDIRQGDVSRKLFPVHFVTEVPEGYYDDHSDRRKRRNAIVFHNFCQQIFIISPDLFPMAPEGSKLIRHAGVDPREWRPAAQPVFAPGKVPLIVHAPSHREVKGTRYIERAVENLRLKGYQFEFLLVEKMSNADARKVYERADLVVDQVFLGWYGVLAIECMAMGKPVISYIRTEDTKHVPKNLVDEIPVLSATPNDVENVMAWCLDHPHEMQDIGARSRRFAEKWYDPIEIARETLPLYDRPLIHP